MIRAAILGAAVASIATAASAQTCLRNGEAITGVFGYIDARHPNGSRIHAPIVTLPRARCAHDDFGDGRGRRVQLVLDPGVQRRLRVGRRITVAGDYGPPETAWHIGDLMAFSARVLDDGSRRRR